MKLESTLPERSATLYTVPLLDSVLLLLVFFLLGSNFILKSGVAVELPFSDSSLPVAETSHIVTISAGDPLQVYFNEKRVEIEDLDSSLEDAVDKSRNVIILADRRADFGRVMGISHLALKHGYEVAFATTSEE